MNPTQRVIKPASRCAVVTVRGKQLVVLSAEIKRAPVQELEPLMFFDTPSSPPRKVDDTERVPWLSKPERQCIIMEANGYGDLVPAEQFKNSTFASFNEAYIAIGSRDGQMEFPAVFGCLLLDKLYLLVASEVELGAVLPLSGVIWKVNKTLWVPLELPGVAPLQMNERDRTRLKEFTEYVHSSGYYYSEDADVQLPFPFCPIGGGGIPDLHCDWSEALRTKLERFGGCGCCTPLIRGFVGERTLTTTKGETTHYLLLGRQNKRNPGPRYYGRGLNNHGAAGNDHYYEFIRWKESGGNVIYAKHAFYRGTIPVRWKTDMESLDGKMIFDSTVYNRSDQYFKELFLNTKKIMQVEMKNDNLNPRILCVSMLRRNAGNKESELAYHFEKAVDLCQKSIQEIFPQSTLGLKHIDWLNLSKEFGLDATVNEFWRGVTPFICSPNGDESPISVGTIDSQGGVCRVIRQNRFLRINCADSLDRTNLGCFFLCLQTLVTMMQTTGSTTTDYQIGASSPIQPLELNQINFPPRQSSLAAVVDPYFDCWSDVMKSNLIAPGDIRAISELFTDNGDCVSRLYTNSAAMHGGVLRGISGARGGSHNAIITAKRYLENTFEDKKKCRNLYLLLGKNRYVYFSEECYAFFTLPVPYKFWDYAVCCTYLPLHASLLDVTNGIATMFKSVGMAVPQMRAEIQEEEDIGDEQASFRVAVVMIFANVHSSSITQCGCMQLQGSNCLVAPYNYIIQSDQLNDSKSVSTTLKDGFRNIMRSLA